MCSLYYNVTEVVLIADHQTSIFSVF